VEDPNNCQSYHQYDFPKTTNLQEGSQEVEDSPEAEDSQGDSQEVEDSPEAEDSLEEADTREEVVYHLEALQEAHGGHPRFQCHKRKPENW